MKLRAFVASLAIGASTIALPLNGTAQGTFQNLDFESAILISVSGDPYGRVQFVSAFPGWTGFVGATPQNIADHNNRSLSEPGIAIMGPDYLLSPYSFQGHYYAQLYTANPGPPIAGSLTQVGTIPVTARSITFWGDAFVGLAVSFGGQRIPISVLDSTATHTVYGGDISGFAGQTGALRLSGSALLDNIQFSGQAIPEPSVVVLSGLSAGLLGWLWWKRARA